MNFLGRLLLVHGPLLSGIYYFFQVSDPEELEYRASKTGGESMIAIIVIMGILVFALGFASGWFLHQRKARKHRFRKRVSHMDQS